ncbi:MAG TPA: hypothetical protein VHG08_01055 [Longimicrobium sp.]|nr:hypothetical protein [Longimicrobium sp.]
MLDFVNRNLEKQSVRDFCEGAAAARKRCLIVRTTRDVGMTFFLRYLERTASDGWFAVYADCGSSDPEVIFRKFFDRLEDRKLLRWRALNPFRELGDAIIRFGSAMLLPSPVATTVGPLTAAVVPKVATTAYASTASERFAKLITSGNWRQPVLFLVDNAQEIKPQSLHILNTVYAQRYNHIRFVLSFVGDADKQAAFEEFHRRLRAFGLGVESIDFPPPDERFIGELASALQAPLPPEEYSALLRTSERSLSHIISFLQRDRPRKEPITPLEQEILRYLLVAGQPLRRDDILTLALRSPRVAVPQGEVQNAISALDGKKLVIVRTHYLGDELEIAPGQTRTVREVLPEFADLVAAQELYAYFSKIAEVKSPRHSESAYGALLYKLAKQVDPEAVSRRAFELVRISLGQADLAAAEHYIKAATGGQSARSVSDLYTLVAFQVSTQNYQPALETLDQLGPGYWQGVRTLRIIHAIALNRVRAHADSDAEIEALLTEPATTDEEFALLTSYRVAGLLHEGKLVRARQVFERALRRIRSARNRGYALRNCAAVYFWGERRDLMRADATLAEATHVFRSQDDAFGVYTTLNNRGALLGEESSPRESAVHALPAFQESFESLAVFGTQHLEEVGANVGVALLLTGEVEKAATHLQKVTAFASIDFPRVIMESALAFTQVVSGEADAARERMRQLTGRVAEVNLPAATYHANLNAAVVEAATGRRDGRFEAYVQATAHTGYWGGGGSLNHVMSGAAAGAITPEVLPDFLSYDYFQYWSQNPLSVVAVPLLAQ